jgi:hypothetical protein
MGYLNIRRKTQKIPAVTSPWSLQLYDPWYFLE